MKKRNIRIYGIIPRLEHRYILVPQGMYFNKDARCASAGDVATFYEGWRGEKAIIVRSCIVKVSSSVSSFLIRSLYGGDTTIEDLFKQWDAYAINEGYGKNAYSKNELMLIELKDIENG